MKRIEERDLIAMGATKEQLEAYNETDPLNIRYDCIAETYSVTGCMDGNGMSACELLDFLQNIYDSWSEE